MVTPRYALAPGHHVRCWPDGCVVLSAPRAQTFLLPAEFAPLLRRAEALAERGGADDQTSIEPASAADEDRYLRLEACGIVVPHPGSSQ